MTNENILSVSWKKSAASDEGNYRWHMDICAMPQYASYTSEEIRWRDYQQGSITLPPPCGRCGERIPATDTPRFMVTISPPSIFNRNCRHGPFCHRCVVKLSRVTIPFCALCKAVSSRWHEEVRKDPNTSTSDSFSSENLKSNSPKRRSFKKRKAGEDASATVSAEPAEERKKISDAPTVLRWLATNVSISTSLRKSQVPTLLRRFDLQDQNVVHALRHWCRTTKWLDADVQQCILDSLPDFNGAKKRPKNNHHAKDSAASSSVPLSAATNNTVTVNGTRKRSRDDL